MWICGNGMLSVEPACARALRWEHTREWRERWRQIMLNSEGLVRTLAFILRTAP